MFDCFSVQFVPPFFNKSETFKMPKNSKKRTNMDINFVILNHATGQTLYHTRRITYSPLTQTCAKIEIEQVVSE